VGSSWPMARGILHSGGQVPLNGRWRVMDFEHVAGHRFPGREPSPAFEVKICLDNGAERPLRQAARNLMVFTPLCGHGSALTALEARPVRVGFPGCSCGTERTREPTGGHR